MDWALGIDTSAAGFGAVLLKGNEVQSVGLHRLVSEGVPAGHRSRVKLDHDMREWRATDPDEYLQAFGFSSAHTSANRHAVYEITGGGRRLLVPALVLMRAFFRPAKILLPRMFWAQALDHIRVVDPLESPPRVHLLSPSWGSVEGRVGDARLPLTWLSVFPTAMEFAASVHRSARAGAIAVTMPAARASISFHGCRSGASLYVTKATMLEVDALEQPLEWARGHPVEVFRRRTVSWDGACPALQVADVPSRRDGKYDLTDDEWAKVEPVLYPPAIRRPIRQLCPRRTFDGVLRKLVLGTGWRATEYPVGTHTNMLYAYRKWNKSGALSRALDILRASPERRA